MIEPYNPDDYPNAAFNESKAESFREGIINVQTVHTGIEEDAAFSDQGPSGGGKYASVDGPKVRLHAEGQSQWR